MTNIPFFAWCWMICWTHMTKNNLDNFSLRMMSSFSRKFRSVSWIKKNDLVCKLDLFLCKRKNEIFVKKYQICFCIKLKKVILSENQICFFMDKKKKMTFWKRIHIHEMNLLYMHHILKKKTKKRLQPNFQFLLLNFITCNFVTKKTFSKKNQICI